MGRRTQVEIATDTLRSLLAHLEALAEMGIPLPIPPELAESCQKIARLAEAPAGKADSIGIVPTQEVAAPPVPVRNRGVVLPQGGVNVGQLAAGAGAHVRNVADVDARESEDPPRATVRDAVLAAIQPDEDVSVGVVVKRLEDVGVVANRDTVSNELSRWTHEGKLERPVRGTYRLLAVGITDPTRDHEPLAAGERPNDEEEVDGVAAARTEGAAM